MMETIDDLMFIRLVIGAMEDNDGRLLDCNWIFTGLLVSTL